MEIISYMHGIENNRNIEECFKAGGYTEINDWTDDFDTPQDINKWEKMRLKFGAK